MLFLDCEGTWQAISYVASFLITGLASQKVLPISSRWMVLGNNICYKLLANFTLYTSNSKAGNNVCVVYFF
jgi:hypothetical protein